MPSGISQMRAENTRQVSASLAVSKSKNDDPVLSHSKNNHHDVALVWLRGLANDTVRELNAEEI
jgi:hypothetical protein